MNETASFGTWIKRRRSARLLSREDLARQVGCAVVTLRKIEADERRPSQQIAERLAALLELADAERIIFVKVARAELACDRLPPARAHDWANSAPSALSKPVPSDSSVHVPVPLTPLIGREAELAQIADRLEQRDCRLLTLVGPGGVGKTRLALQAAINLRSSFPNGVHFVPLAALDSAALLVPAIAGALGCIFHGSTDPQAQLIAHLREQQILLVLDNFEQLLAGANILVDLIQAAPGVKLLVTSREPLHLRGEWLLDIQGLPVPERADDSGVEQSSAVRLFVQTANRMQANFALSPETVPSVVRICQLVVGMPLAIELAAGWVRSRSCGEIARELEQSLESLATTMHDVPARHRSMRAVFDHSWRLLSDAEQGVLRRLSVFRGGMQADAAARVAGATPLLLAALVDKSLLHYNGTGRYELHELVRQYVDEQLAQSGEAESTHDTHAADFLALADASNPGLDGPERAIWLVRLEQEHDNLRAALAWCQAAGRIELGLRLVIALRMFWCEHGHLQEGWTWLEAALAPSSVDVPRSLRAAALNSASIVSSDLGEYVRAQELAEQSLALFRADEIPEGIAWALTSLAHLAMVQDDNARAYMLAEESLALYQELDNRWGIASSLGHLGVIARSQGDYARAVALFDESLTRFPELLEDKAGIATGLCLRGEMLHAQGDNLRAAALLEQSLALFRELENKGEIPWALGHLARVVHTQGDDRRATGLFQEGLELAQEYGDKPGMAGCLEGLAGIAALHSQPFRATHLFAAAARLRETIGAQLHRRPIDGIEYERTLGITRAQLDTATFAAAWAQGRAMPLEHAIAEALQPEGMAMDPMSVPRRANPSIDEWDTHL